MVAANSDSVYTVESSGIYRHEIQESGALNAPGASIKTQDYGGAACGQPNGSGIMDRTGQHLTVELYSAGEESSGSYIMLCDTWQTYQVQPGGGFVFEGYDDSDPYSYTNTGTESLGVSAVSGNNQFAYGVVHIAWVATAFTMMQRDSTSTLVRVPKFGEMDPAPDPAGDHYFPLLVSADSSNHLAVVVYEPFATNPAMGNGSW